VDTRVSGAGRASFVGDGPAARFSRSAACVGGGRGAGTKATATLGVVLRSDLLESAGGRLRVLTTVVGRWSDRTTAVP